MSVRANGPTNQQDGWRMESNAWEAPTKGLLQASWGLGRPFAGPLGLPLDSSRAEAILPR